MPHTLPPGQRAIEGFPRFGVTRTAPPPVPDAYVVEVVGPLLAAPLRISAADLDALPRHDVVADHHCVAGWSALGLHWSGYRWRDVLDTFVTPALTPEARVRHLAFTGLDSYRSVALADDLEGDRVLLADRLDGAPLTARHGAPLRLISPDQYGYIGVKHLHRVEVSDTEPHHRFHADRRVDRVLHAVHPHGRARVWHEERRRHLPSRVARFVYRWAVPLPGRPLETPVEAVTPPSAPRG